MLRTLVRDRGNLVASAADWLRRMQKALDQMNVRVHRAVKDIDGMTGMAMIRAIVKDERDPLKLAKFRHPHCKKSEQEMVEELTGHWPGRPPLQLAGSVEDVRCTAGGDRRL
jgi:transposase